MNWKKHSGSANLSQAASLNFVKRQTSCQNYLCRIAKFGEDIYYSHAVASGRLSVRCF